MSLTCSICAWRLTPKGSCVYFLEEDLEAQSIPHPCPWRAGLAGGVEPLGQQGQPVQLPGGKGPDRYVHGITSTCAGPERPGSDPLIFLGL